MLTSNLTAEIDSKQIHNTYIADSDAYRMMRPALQDQRRARQSQHPALQDQRRARQARLMPDGPGCCLIEWFGARLIALGRALCERRGTLAVEIAFHAEQGDPTHKPGGRHVA